MSNYNTTGRPGMGERIMESIPGTEQHRATHGMGGSNAGGMSYGRGTDETYEHHRHEAGHGAQGPVGGYSGMGTYMSGADTGPTMGERIKQSIPGTNEYEARRGTDETYEHHRHETGHGPEGPVGGYSGMGTYMSGADTGPTMGERIKQSIPGTNEYKATHGMTGSHNIPGTEEHHGHMGMAPHHHDMAGVGTMGTHDNHGAGMRDTHHAHDATTGPMASGVFYNEAGRETVGYKVMKNIPGTREHEDKKLQQGRI